MDRTVLLAGVWLAALVLAACGSGSTVADPGPPGGTPTAIRTAPSATAPASEATAPSSVAACGEAAEITALDPGFIGKTYRERDQLALKVSYAGRGCKMIGATFWGVHRAGSPWYETHCQQGCDGSVTTAFKTGQMALRSSDGQVMLKPKVGTSNAAPLGADATLEGFVLCNVVITMDDGVFGGRYFEQTIGSPCE